MLVEGAGIVEVGPRITAADAVESDAAGKIVLPGFVNPPPHHRFEAALCGQLANAILVNDGRPSRASNQYETMPQDFSMHDRPEDVNLNELFG